MIIEEYSSKRINKILDISRKVVLPLLLVFLLPFTACDNETPVADTLNSQSTTDESQEATDNETAKEENVTEQKSESETDTKTEIKTTTTMSDINPDSFVYPNEPLTPENLSYIVNGALEKLMAQEIVEESPRIYEIILIDINFDNFPEMVFKDTIEKEGLNSNKVYSLKKEKFGEYLFDIEAWGRNAKTGFYVNEESEGKRFIVKSSYANEAYEAYEYTEISEILKTNGTYSPVKLYSESWSYDAEADILSRTLKINDLICTPDEYKAELVRFNSNLIGLQIAETKIEYTNGASDNSSFPILTYNADSSEQQEIYFEYCEYLKKLAAESVMTETSGTSEENAAEWKGEKITLVDINPDGFVYPDGPLTPEKLSYIVNGALEKLMAEEIVEESPTTYDIILIDIDFDEFPELVFKSRKYKGFLNTNKAYSLKKENFGEHLLDFKGWGRDTVTRIFAKSGSEGKRFITISDAAHVVWYGVSLVSEFIKRDGVFSSAEIYRNEWSYNPSDYITSRTSTINGVEFTYPDFRVNQANPL
jgi:peptide methionine sulfoxide reductase MsrB